jgi:hypothetical protein
MIVTYLSLQNTIEVSSQALTLNRSFYSYSITSELNVNEEYTLIFITVP